MTPFWLRWRWLILAVAAVTALLGVDRCSTARASEAIGRWREVAKRLQADSARAASSIRHVDSVYTRDTLRLTRTVSRYTTLRDTIVAHLTDTLRVREFVTLADSAIGACRAVVTTCEQRVAARDSMIVVLGQQRRADRSLFRAQLTRANPRIVKFGEALADPMDSQTLQLRAGLEVRIAGHVRLVGAGSYVTTGEHRLRPFVGVRVTF